MITVIYFWRISIFNTPLAIFHMALDRFSLRRNKSVTFYKSLGTGKGETFTPRDADATRWGLLVVIPESDFEKFHNSALVNSWRKFSISEYSAKMLPLSSHGQWARQEPFTPTPNPPANTKIAAITRARIKWSLQSHFWKAVPEVTRSLHSKSGLISAIGIGEAPLGLQGTFSVWRDSASLREFAYKDLAHAQVIQETKDRGWYSEELFARFAIIEEHGDLNPQG